jgi:hypothetical protein
MRRLLGVREPAKPGYHQQLFNNQKVFINLVRSILITYFVTQIHPHFVEFKGVELEAEEHYDDPHQKRLLRINAFNELTESAERFTAPWVKSAWYKMKKAEWAKPGKKPRMIVDLGTAASLYGFRLTEFLKTAQAEEDLYINGGCIHFCKSPDPFALTEVFNHLINPPGRFYFVYFSDDSCFSVRTPTGVKFYNLDISSCDASHSKHLFKLFAKLVPESCRSEFKNLIRQCKVPLRIYDVLSRKLLVILKPIFEKLYSGSTITTAINNLANLLIAISLSMLSVYTPESIREAAERAGYIVTGCEQLEDMHKLQFLKHSPVFDTSGVLRPVLNLGVLLRASGTTHGDLAGKGSIPSRARAFMKNLVNGAYPHTHFPFVEAMRRKFSDASEYRGHIDALDKVVKSDYPHFEVSCNEIYQRYDLASHEVVMLDEMVATSDVGETYSCSGADKILALDYGITTTRAHQPLYMCKAA